MQIIEIILLSVGVSLDTFAVSLAKGIESRKL